MKKGYSVFKKSKNEQNRLDLQNIYGNAYTENVIKSVFANLKSDLVVFDLGCFNGSSTKSFFKNFESQCKRIIGMDFVENAIEEANKETRNGKYKFVFADLESPKLKNQLKNCLKEENKKHLDVVFISYVLLHLKNPQKLLETLASLSDENTVVIIKDTEDSLKVCHPHNEILQEEIELYSKIRNMTRYSDRFIGRKLPKMLVDAGFRNVQSFEPKTTTLGRPLEQRKDLYKILFSFRENPKFPESENNQEEYKQLCKRNKELLAQLKLLFESEDFFFIQFTFVFVAKK